MEKVWICVARGSPVERRKGAVAVSHFTAALPYLVAMIVVVVGVDVLFLREHFWARLLVNIGIVAAFAGFYLRFFGFPHS